MKGDEDGAPRPELSKGARPLAAFWLGLRGAVSVPVLVVAVSFVGFGALAHDFGLDIFQALFISGSMFALPGQVVLVDELAKGAGLAATALAVTLTSIRLLPMAFSLFPVLRSARTSRVTEVTLAHFVAITIWLESMRRLPGMPRELRTAYFSGFAVAQIMALFAATAAGYRLAAAVPEMVAAGMVFLTPLYFMLSLIEGARGGADRIAIVAGLLLGPAMSFLFPGFDLLLTGLLGGTLSYAAIRWRKGRLGT